MVLLLIPLDSWNGTIEVRYCFIFYIQTHLFYDLSTNGIRIEAQGAIPILERASLSKVPLQLSGH
jgi:hypothetical protein